MKNASDQHVARRKFLAMCGKFTAVTPPVISLMLSSSQAAYGRADSGSLRGGTAAPAPTADAWGNPYKPGTQEWNQFVLSGQRPPEMMSPGERNLWFGVNGGRSTAMGGLWSFR